MRNYESVVGLTPDPVSAIVLFAVLFPGSLQQSQDIGSWVLDFCHQYTFSFAFDSERM